MFQFFWILLVILKQCLSNLPVAETQRFNFPLEVSYSNTIYLSDYTLGIVEAPYYQIACTNQFNLQIDQSISQLFSMDSNQSIRIGSNFVVQSGVYSRTFWVLTQEDRLYRGEIQKNGKLDITQLDFIITMNCFQINLITIDFGMLSCLNQGDFEFILLNSTSLQYTDVKVNYSLQFQYENPIVQIQSVNTTSITFFLIYTTPDNVDLVHFSYNHYNIELISEKIFVGKYLNAFLSEDSNILFLVSSEHLQFYNIIENTGLQEIINQNTLNHDNDDFQPISYFATFQINNNLFHMVFLQNQRLTSFIYDTNYINLHAQKLSFYLNQYHTIVKLQVTFSNIYIVSDTFIINLFCKDTIKATGYHLLSSGTYALFQVLRKMVVVQESFNNLNKVSTYLIDKPQIFIPQDITKQIAELDLPLKLDILVISQLNSSLKHYEFSIQIIQIDITDNQIPISFYQQINELVLTFPEEILLQKGSMFLGPNLTASIECSNPQSLSAIVQPNSIGQWSIYNATYSIACIFSKQEQIYCTQFRNNTIQIVDQSSAYSPQKYIIQASQNLIKCSCIKSLSEINVLMQFQQSLLVQQFNYSLYPLNSILFLYQLDIISATIFKETIFAITIDGKLTATALQNKLQLFTISNFKFNEIYTNQFDYPDYIFIDNLVNLVILAYNGKQSYEFINTILYPIKNFTNIAIGIVKEGIYFAFLKESQSFLYFYPIINIFLQNNIENYFQVYLEQYQLYNNPEIMSTYTSKNFYLICVKDGSYYLSQYQASGTSYTALYSSRYISDIINFSIQQLSSITYQEGMNYNQIVYMFTSRQQSLYYSFFSFSFIIATYFKQEELTDQLYLQYNLSNENFTSSFKQNVTVIIDKDLLIARDVHDKLVYNISNQTKIKINPQELFYGNIQNYTATCDLCKSFNFTQPIDQINSFSLNISVRNLLNQDELIYLQDQTNSLYQFFPSTRKLSTLFTLSKEMEQNCATLFIEIQTQFPVQICSEDSTTFIYAYNTSSKQVIMYKFNEVSDYSSSNYNNGILSVLTGGKFQKLLFFSFYFLISNDQIQLIQFYESKEICVQCEGKFVYLSMSKNFTTQPCQIFGFITTLKSGYLNNDIYLLKNCIPANIAEHFGFSRSKSTLMGNIYFQKSIWMLKKRRLIPWPFVLPSIQFGSSKYISENVIEAKFIVSLPDIVDLYLILFNEINGEILAFTKDRSFYLAWSYSDLKYSVSQGKDELLMIENFQSQDQFKSQIYAYQEQKHELNLISKRINRMVGFELISQNFLYSSFHTQLSGNYYYFGNKTYSQLYYVQNYLTLSIDLHGVQNAQIDIISKNPINQIKQSFLIVNQNYQNDTNLGDSSSPKNLDYVSLLLLYSCLIILLLILLAAPRCIKPKNRSTLQSISFELIEK